MHLKYVCGAPIQNDGVKGVLISMQQMVTKAVDFSYQRTRCKPFLSWVRVYKPATI